MSNIYSSHPDTLVRIPNDTLEKARNRLDSWVAEASSNSCLSSVAPDIIAKLEAYIEHQWPSGESND